MIQVMIPSRKLRNALRKAFALLLFCNSVPSARPASGHIDFDREIRPIFSDNCYQCHGPDEKARKAKLRLDTREGAFRIRNDKTVIIAGKSNESELVRRITSKDPEEMMPPPDSNHKLTPVQIELLRKWI